MPRPVLLFTPSSRGESLSADPVPRAHVAAEQSLHPAPEPADVWEDRCQAALWRGSQKAADNLPAIIKIYQWPKVSDLKLCERKKKPFFFSPQCQNENAFHL